MSWKAIFTSKETKQKQFDQTLTNFIYDCENSFFVNGKLMLNNDLKIFLVGWLLSMNPNETKIRNKIVALFTSMYRITNDNLREYSTKFDINASVDSFNALHMEGKIAFVLLIHCMLYIESPTIPQTVAMAINLFSYINIDYTFYKKIVEEFKRENHYPEINFIFEVKL